MRYCLEDAFAAIYYKTGGQKQQNALSHGFEALNTELRCHSSRCRAEFLCLFVIWLQSAVLGSTADSHITPLPASVLYLSWANLFFSFAFVYLIEILVI